ncbi:hypothetical protein [Priestia endophytica]|uniref:hypothetical protein n=1 Tax=Priestia endophytica TaxID=135735 RepID=UPI0020416A17|nr:hypothetical protein [Priestia endophytica]MCM3538573.1 hypothetical protein [Priestia endophytica]
MKKIVLNVSEKWVSMLKEQKEKNYMSKTKEYLKKSGVWIPITPEVLLWCLEKKGNLPIIEPHLSFLEEGIAFSGKVKKLGISLPFEIRLSPFKASNRSLTFQVLYVKPLNSSWLKRKIFHNEPLSHYSQNLLTINLNEISKIRYVPVGNIKDFEIKDGKVFVKLGV